MTTMHDCQIPTCFFLLKSLSFRSSFLHPQSVPENKKGEDGHCHAGHAKRCVQLPVNKHGGGIVFFILRGCRCSRLHDCTESCPGTDGRNGSVSATDPDSGDMADHCPILIKDISLHYLYYGKI